MSNKAIVKGHVYECPYCSKVVVLCDETQMVYHDMPLCSEFIAKMHSLGLEVEDEPFIITALPIPVTEHRTIQ